MNIMHIMCFGFATLFHKWQKNKKPKNTERLRQRTCWAERLRQRTAVCCGRNDLDNKLRLSYQKDLGNELQAKENDLGNKLHLIKYDLGHTQTGPERDRERERET